jgi:hypothetical protein
LSFFIYIFYDDSILTTPTILAANNRSKHLLYKDPIVSTDKV